MLPALVHAASLVASHTSATSNITGQDLTTQASFRLKVKPFLLFFAFYNLTHSTFAQHDSFDIVKYTPLKGWEKDVRGNLTSYRITNNKTGGWCVIRIVKSTISKGSIEKDFESEWNDLIVKPYEVKDAPQTNEVREADGWNIKRGSGKFILNNANAIALLTTMSDYKRCVNIVANTNNQDYLAAIQTFLESVDLKKPQATVNANTAPANNTVQKNNGAKKDGFAFNTTNLDNSWSNVEKEDWVEVTKNNIRILLHYKHSQADAYNSDLVAAEKNAWNILETPRYSSAANMNFKPHSSWQSIEFANADMTESATGKKVYVVFFKKHYSNGSGTHLEFITPSWQTFESEFGKYTSEETWDKVEKMAGYNRFAVAAGDLNGIWTNNFTGITQYVIAYTGTTAGANTHTSSEKFEFGTGNTYKWNIGVASGFVVNIKFQSTKSNGKFTVVNPWQINFSDMEGKPKSYNAYFSCSKDTRVLWLQDKAYGEYNTFGRTN